jgi:hypothetical protein
MNAMISAMLARFEDTKQDKKSGGDEFVIFANAL